MTAAAFDLIAIVLQRKNRTVIGLAPKTSKKTARKSLSTVLVRPGTIGYSWKLVKHKNQQQQHYYK